MPHDDLNAPGASERRGAERLLPLEGGRNFRDMGGYPTADGRRVRWGRLYRSGSMSALTPPDYDHLKRLGVAVICDLRSNAERAAEPILWDGPDAPRRIERDYDMPLSDLMRTMRQGGATPAEVRDAMLRLYGRLAYDHAESYRRLFEALLETDGAVIFKCAAGKDRTGVAAALLLLTLGVPRPLVVEDYSLSEKVVDYEKIARRPNSVGFGHISKLAPELRAPLMRSDPEYLESALDYIIEREGSLERYMQGHLGFSAAHAERLRDRLLEPA